MFCSLPDAKVSKVLTSNVQEHSNSIYLSTTTSSSTWPEVGKLLPGINYTRSRLRVFSKLKHRTSVSSEVIWDHHTWHTYSSICMGTFKVPMVHSLRLDPEGIFIDIKTILKTKSLPCQNHSRSCAIEKRFKGMSLWYPSFWNIKDRGLRPWPC